MVENLTRFYRKSKEIQKVYLRKPYEKCANAINP